MSGRVRDRQAGQAMAEALLAVPLLAALWAGIAHVGDLAHAGVRAADLARHHAFLAAARVDPLRPAALHPVQAREGERIDTVRLAVRSEMSGATPGEGHARMLRHEWLAQDPGLLRARVSVAPRPAWRAGTALKPPQRPLSRYTVVATGAAHSSGDAQAQDRIALSPTGWGEAAALSRQHGMRVAQTMRRVDGPWRRAAPDFDWLRPWQGVVPDALRVRSQSLVPRLRGVRGVGQGGNSAPVPIPSVRRAVP